MSIISKHSLFAVSAVAALVGFSPAYAQSTQRLEKEQFGNSASPDVLPDSSQTGPSQSITKQEKDQLNNSASPDVLPDASQTGPSQSIPAEEKSQIK